MRCDLARIFSSILLCVLFLTACAGWPANFPRGGEASQAPEPGNQVTPSPFLPAKTEDTQQPAPGETSSPAITSTTGEEPTQPAPRPERSGLWLAPYLPASLLRSLVLPANIEVVETQEEAVLRLETGDDHPVSRWVYALVAPFPTIPDGVTSSDLRQSWQGQPAEPFAGQPILIDESTYGVFAAMWGEAAPGAVMILAADELVDYAWEHQPSWAIIPFESIRPPWKVLEVDGLSPLRKDFSVDDYALTAVFSIKGEAGMLAELAQAATGNAGPALNLPVINRDPQKFTTVVLTGVTALVRATAYTMRSKGITYPAEDIGELLREADITHISNEIPFYQDCPPPNPRQEGLRFCSDPSYIALLEEVGTDVVELTGDHFGDYGPEAMRYTLDLYKQRSWEYYGGGFDRQDARQARLFEHNGNLIAFIGCNAKGGGYATASETQPGAVACDFPWMHAEITRLAGEGYNVIVTFQHFEYYTYYAQPNQVADAHGMVESGAVIVSGSQAHQPQGMEILGDAFIHYGLGNLFFDQFQYCANFTCDDAFINRHAFYDGRYLGAELITIKFVDYARPRFMTPDEREELLRKVFNASEWARDR
jgi:hypothetical protein